MKLLIEITEYNKEWIENASEIPQEINVEIANAIRNGEQKTGEWKPKNHHTDYCSNCGFEETQWRTADYNFCPSCGIRMKGVDDEYIV